MQSSVLSIQAGWRMYKARVAYLATCRAAQLMQVGGWANGKIQEGTGMHRTNHIRGRCGVPPHMDLQHSTRMLTCSPFCYLPSCQDPPRLIKPLPPFVPRPCGAHARTASPTASSSPATPRRWCSRRRGVGTRRVRTSCACAGRWRPSRKRAIAHGSSTAGSPSAYRCEARRRWVHRIPYTHGASTLCTVFMCHLPCRHSLSPSSQPAAPAAEISRDRVFALPLFSPQARDRAALQAEEARVNAKVEAEWFSALRSEYGMDMEDVPTAFAAWQKCREAGE